MSQYAKEKKKFIAKFGKLNSERAAFAKSQRINKEILSNTSSI
jgi:heme exporter protein D